jgi:hypothetical protein
MREHATSDLRLLFGRPAAEAFSRFHTELAVRDQLPEHR